MAAAFAYMMWGFLPLYLKLLSFVDVREVLAQRILWARRLRSSPLFVMSGPGSVALARYRPGAAARRMLGHASRSRHASSS